MSLLFVSTRGERWLQGGIALRGLTAPAPHGACRQGEQVGPVWLHMGNSDEGQTHDQRRIGQARRMQQQIGVARYLAVVHNEWTQVIAQ